MLGRRRKSNYSSTVAKYLKDLSQKLGVSALSSCASDALVYGESISTDISGRHDPPDTS